MLDGHITKRQLLDLFDRLENRIKLLDNKNKALVQLFQAGGEFRPLADSCGVNRATIGRRLKKIAARITSDKFTQTIMNANDSKIMKERFINGKSVRQIAIETGLSRYKIGKMIKEVKN
jgi:hypothetical protein